MKLSEFQNSEDFKKITIKNYIPLAEKSAIVDSIVEQCLIDQDGMKVVDYAKKILSIDLAFVIYYSDIELDVENSYDYMIQNKIINYVKFEIGSTEIETITYLVDNIINENKEVYNSVAGVINRNLSNLINKIPDSKEMNKIIKEIPKNINKINPDYLQTIMSVFKKEKLGGE